MEVSLCFDDQNFFEKVVALIITSRVKHYTSLYLGVRWTWVGEACSPPLSSLTAQSDRRCLLLLLLGCMRQAHSLPREDLESLNLALPPLPSFSLEWACLKDYLALFLSPWDICPWKRAWLYPGDI